MTDNQSNLRAGANAESLRGMLECVRQITRDFENMAARRRMDGAELAGLSGELGQTGGNVATAQSVAIVAALQEIEQGVARRKALGKELCQAASGFAEALIKWVNAVKERRSLGVPPKLVMAAAAAADAEVEAPPLTGPPLEIPGTPVDPELPVPEPVPEVPNLGPATVVAVGVAVAAAAAEAWALTLSEVFGKREKNIIIDGNPYGPNKDIYRPSYTGVSTDEEPDVQKGWILYDGERRGQDGTIYAKDGQIAVHANGTSALSNEERAALSRSSSTGYTGIIRNVNLAGQKHPVTGIPFNANGFPDFSSVAIKTVEIKYTGTRLGDESAANEKAGLTETPEGYTWHHMEDGKTMQLVPSDIHRLTGHTGGFSMYPH